MLKKLIIIVMVIIALFGCSNKNEKVEVNGKNLDIIQQEKTNNEIEKETEEKTNNEIEKETGSEIKEIVDNKVEINDEEKLDELAEMFRVAYQNETYSELAKEMTISKELNVEEFQKLYANKLDLTDGYYDRFIIADVDNDGIEDVLAECYGGSIGVMDIVFF